MISWTKQAAMRSMPRCRSQSPNYSNPIGSYNCRHQQCARWNGGAGLTSTSWTPPSSLRAQAISLAPSGLISPTQLRAAPHTGLITISTGTQMEYILWSQSRGEKKFHLLGSADGKTHIDVVWGTAPIDGSWYNICAGWNGSNGRITLNGATCVTAPI